jgi:hypothetical protein
VPVPALADSSVVPYLKDAHAVALMPQLVQSLAKVDADYDLLFGPHARAHGELFERVSLDLEGGAGGDPAAFAGTRSLLPGERALGRRLVDRWVNATEEGAFTIQPSLLRLVVETAP